MIKVRILDRCDTCEGEAYILECQDVDTRGEPYDRYRPCEMCHASILTSNFIKEDINFKFDIHYFLK